MENNWGRADNAEEGFKCRNCGFMWAGGEVVDRCPQCGNRCDPDTCLRVTTSNEDY